MVPAARVVVAAMMISGCAIDALVGENPDVAAPRDTAAVDATVLDLPGPDAPATDRPALIDAPAADLPPPPDVPAPDLATVPDVALEDVRSRDSTAMMSGAGFDAAVDAGPDATADAGDVTDATMDANAMTSETAVALDASTLDDTSPMEDLALLPDAGLGRPCRRDADCAGDPAGPFCSLLLSRCAAMR